MQPEEIDLLLATEITLFFARNPFTIESSAGLARKLRRRDEPVTRILEALVERQVLVREGNGTLFAYAPPYIAEVG